MTATLAEKIIARASGRDHVGCGEVVTAKVDLAVVNDLSGPLAVKQFAAAGGARVFDPARVAIFAGRHMPFNDAGLAADVSALGRFCREQGIAHFYAGGEGMDHALMPEYGLVRPGMLICDGDSHVCTAGALGALGVPMGSTDMAYVLAFGETWLRVPPSLRVNLSGALAPFVTAKDIVLALAARIGVEGARYKVLEFGGQTLHALSIDERMTIANLGIEMGAKSALMPSDAAVEAYLSERTTAFFEPLTADDDATYEARIEIDVGAIEPSVATPHLPSNLTPANALADIRLTQINIGSCTNGRLSDLQQAASLLKGRKVAKGVRLIVTPATDIVYRQAAEAGLLTVFAQAGAMVNPPGCGPCAGWHLGVLGADDVCLATHNRNFRGRMGHRDAQIYLSSPYVAAASALTGVITDPRAIEARL